MQREDSVANAHDVDADLPPLLEFIDGTLVCSGSARNRMKPCAFELETG